MKSKYPGFEHSLLSAAINNAQAKQDAPTLAQLLMARDQYANLLGDWMHRGALVDELLAALAALESGIYNGRLQTFEDRERWRKEAKAAIAKARGQS